MRHGSCQREAETLTGEHERRSARAADVRGARSAQRSVDAVVAASREVEERSSGARFRHPRGLRGDHRVVSDGVEQKGFDDLRFDERRAYLDERFVREGDFAFGNCPDFALEPRPRELAQELIREERQ